jgi:ketosteroid isomerase-like protein
MAALSHSELIRMVETYFARVDAKNLAGVLALLTPDCVFRIETAGIEHAGRDSGVASMFERLFARYAAVWHGDFRHVADPAAQRIASQFRVTNTAFDGAKTYKSNCNFFTLADGKFARVSIYMMGENSLT